MEANASSPQVVTEPGSLVSVDSQLAVPSADPAKGISSKDSNRALSESGAVVPKSVELKNPPRAPLVLRVGVVGHRPDLKKHGLPDVHKLRETSRDLLKHIQDFFTGVMKAHDSLFAAVSPLNETGKAASGLRLISALAEGSDQWVADEAHKLGYELQVVLPFKHEDYEQDFHTDAVLKEHRRLRDLATTVFELDGCRSDRQLRSKSYLAAGRVVLNQTDVLLAIWDGEDEKGIGGTGQIVREALQRGIPTLWVSWRSPNQWQLEWRLLEQLSAIKGNFEALERIVWQLLAPPKVANKDDKTAIDPCESYFSECRRSWTPLGGWWDVFKNLFLAKLGLPKFKVSPFRTKTEENWKADWKGAGEQDKRTHTLPDTLIDWVQKQYLDQYGWANQLSIYYGNHYRSSFLWIYLLGALAVLLALIGTTAQVPHWLETILIIAEAVVIIAIIGLTGYGRRHHWHERWIEYRIVAEQLRLSRFNCLLGGVWQQVNVPSHLVTSGNNPSTTWMHWYARAIERAAGLPRRADCQLVTVDEQYLNNCQETILKALILDQVAYHNNNAERLRKVEHRLHRFGASLFVITFFACLAHLGFAWKDTHPTWQTWLIFFAAFLPAWGAGLAGVRSQGEFHRVSQRSGAMKQELEHQARLIASVPTRGAELNSQKLQEASEKASRLMYNEVLDWHIVFQDRPLDWPS